MGLEEEAKELGFYRAWLVPVPDYEDWNRQSHAPQADYIFEDPRQAYPWARGLLLLVWAYAPYAPHCRFSGYYPASNQSYHAMQALRKRMEARGQRSESARVPLKKCMERYRLGSRMENSLMALPHIGTRFILQGLMVEEEGRVPKGEEEVSCLHCGRCRRACPAGAIEKDGYHWEKCLRTYMEEDMPEWVMEKMTAVLGCERCQQVCPLNREVPCREMTAEEQAAFAPETLLKGEQKAALGLIGKNMKKGNKLIAQSAVVSALEGKTELLPLMVERLEQEIPDGERKALLWAISRLQREEK